ncbi:ferrochelatase [Comamonas serinivorans]|uniref:Ferrochelatase n=1 Tax=Comamonas serinivorans TaxID=1082851 RepID=A0A1Y0ELH5_9BURK|nr:ferrochelatase [Comamonas serinivorans]ARU04426.1 ferrochelatase [Comamonas serinivorans]
MPTRDVPEFDPVKSPVIGVLLCNLGTPDAPTPSAVRRYLAEFLSDPRVVEIPAALWKPILHGVILPRRPRQSAEKYGKVWLPEGSPLQVWTEKQALLLRGWLGERGHDRVRVRHAMRYGKPSIADQLTALREQDRCEHILVVSLYPQYSATTTASVIDAVNAWTAEQRDIPELRFANRFFADPGYIRALARRVMEHWQQHGQPDQLVMSFHGIPERNVQRGDPYARECEATAALLAERLALKPNQFKLTYQSRFGRAKWLEPYTQPTIESLARQGARRVDVVCPGFVSDCLETLEEIGLECRDAFLAAGGQEFHQIPCLNDSRAWMAALVGIVEDHLGGWSTRGCAAETRLPQVAPHTASAPLR